MKRKVYVQINTFIPLFLSLRAPSLPLTFSFTSFFFHPSFTPPYYVPFTLLVLPFSFFFSNSSFPFLLSPFLPLPSSFLTFPPYHSPFLSFSVSPSYLRINLSLFLIYHAVSIFHLFPHPPSSSFPHSPSLFSFHFYLLLLHYFSPFFAV